MADIVDFPKTKKDSDLKLIEAIIKSNEFKVCLENFERLGGFDKLCPHQIASGFYAHGFMDALEIDGKK